MWVLFQYGSGPLYSGKSFEVWMGSLNSFEWHFLTHCQSGALFPGVGAILQHCLDWLDARHRQHQSQDKYADTAFLHSNIIVYNVFINFQIILYTFLYTKQWIACILQYQIPSRPIRSKFHANLNTFQGCHMKNCHPVYWLVFTCQCRASNSLSLTCHTIYTPWD